MEPNSLINPVITSKKQPEPSWNAPQGKSARKTFQQAASSFSVDREDLCLLNSPGRSWARPGIQSCNMLAFCRSHCRWLPSGAERAVGMWRSSDSSRTDWWIPERIARCQFLHNKGGGGMLWKHELMDTVAVFLKSRRLNSSWLDLPGAPLSAHLRGSPHIFTAEFQIRVWCVRLPDVLCQHKSNKRCSHRKLWPPNASMSSGRHPESSSPAWLRIITPGNFDSQTHPRVTLWLNYSFICSALPRLVW